MMPDETRLIIERWNGFLDEGCNRFFDKDGHFTSREKAAAEGGTYSISTAASERCGDKESKPGKMKVTKSGKLKPKFTLAQCGRTNAQTGEKKKKDRRCYDYGKGGRYGDDSSKNRSEGIDAVNGMPVSDIRKRRQEQPQERRERNFPGNRELTRLASGIYEADGGGLLIHPSQINPSEIEATWGSVLGEQEGKCPSNCIQQVLDLFARIKQAEKGEA